MDDQEHVIETGGRHAMKTIQTELPETLYNEAAALAQSGWFRDEQEIISEALRRFLESHQPELMEQFIRDDVEWGLHGED